MDGSMADLTKRFARRQMSVTSHGPTHLAIESTKTIAEFKTGLRSVAMLHRLDTGHRLHHDLVLFMVDES